MIEKFLTTEQVANILQVHPFTILKFLKAGKLRGVKLGRVYRIKESDVQAFLESRMTRSARLNEMAEMIQPETQPELQAVEDEISKDQNLYTLRKDDNGEDGLPHYII
ncbi:MAG: helix-turn-helix domain-containing protein [Candidatus Peregrinibacteria bacterium]|nr:helix-turn-helix domain-containing protein [Candidatus Peregrinibacteria bacterium]